MSNLRRRRLFRKRNLINIWNDSSSDDNDENIVTTTTITPLHRRHHHRRHRRQNTNDQLNIEMIDLTDSPKRHTSSIPQNTLPNLVSASIATVAPSPLTVQSFSRISVEQQQLTSPYSPYTLQQNNPRYSILPALPTSFYNNRPHLLLANVPMNKLNVEQLARRQKGAFPYVYTMNETNLHVPSYFRNHYHMFIQSLIDQYRIDEAILDYNLYRFSQCYQIMADDCIRRHKYRAEQFELNDQQKKYALEFYLQIDADVFFLKTCAFRGAQPRSTNEGLFCINEPTSQYSLLQCQNCTLCTIPYDLALRHQQPYIRFGPNQTFRFVNGYRTFLNCQADCQTRNIIYVLICPCGQYEYIGETNQRLSDRLKYHRQHFNRIIHEFLIGELNVELTRQQPKDQETLVKDRMLLYRHIARCPTAMQLFLNFNPIYWPFVPITIDEAEQRNQSDVLPTSVTLLDTMNSIDIGSKDSRAILATPNTRSDETVRLCIRNLPPVPHEKLDVTAKPHDSIDLFNAAFIAVLPLDASEPVRRFIESLFITHTEAKLNTSGRLVAHHQQSSFSSSSDENKPSPIPPPPPINAKSTDYARIMDRGEWCRNLVLHFNNP